MKKPFGCVEQSEHVPEPAQAPVESNRIRIEVRSTFVFMGPPLVRTGEFSSPTSRFHPGKRRRRGKTITHPEKYLPLRLHSPGHQQFLWPGILRAGIRKCGTGPDAGGARPRSKQWATWLLSRGPAILFLRTWNSPTSDQAKHPTRSHSFRKPNRWGLRRFRHRLFEPKEYT